MNCLLFAVRNGFNEYAETLLNATDHDLHRLVPCREQVCTALWGAENGDISGIGMMTGYILDQLIGLLLTLPIVTLSPETSPALITILHRGLASFHDSATFFAFAIELASIVMLVQLDLGISANGMGDNTTRIVYAVAMLVLLPLTYSVLAIQERKPSSSPISSTGTKERLSQSLVLFVLCWTLAFYPFYSAMNAAFGPSRISTDETAALSPAQLHIIEEMCFRDVDPVTTDEGRLMTSFVILTYIPLSVALISSILWSGIRSNHKGSAIERRLQGLADSIPVEIKTYGMIAAFAAVPLLGAGHIWAIFRARQAQKQLAVSLHTADGDDGWTFGQVAAVTLFVPVIFECWHGFVTHRRRGHIAQVVVEDEKPQSAHSSPQSATTGR